MIKTLIGFAVAGLLLRWWLRRETRKPYGSSEMFIDPILVNPEWVPPLGYLGANRSVRILGKYLDDHKGPLAEVHLVHSFPTWISHLLDRHQP